VEPAPAGLRRFRLERVLVLESVRLESVRLESVRAYRNRRGPGAPATKVT